MAVFHEQIGQTPPAHDRERANGSLEDLKSACTGREELAELASLLESSPPILALLTSIFGNSSYLTGLAIRDPEGLQDWLVSEPEDCFARLDEELRQTMASADKQETAMRALRLYKKRAALWLALADVGAVWDVMRVTHVLSEVAGTAITEAVRYLFARAAQSGKFTPSDPASPEASMGYFVLGLGKLGAFELNYSSDVDLIIFYDPERAALGDSVEPAQFFVRMTRDLVSLLQERTADGYVFRTDLRLRPDPGATQVALSTDAGLSYYESFGLNWERAALIKARTIAGDLEAGEEFLDQLSPFIWRKYLDYAAIADIHTMKRRVHEFKGHGEIAVAGHDVKLGRGGIREIEFLVQTHQLIAGGRQNELRCRATLETLDRLVERKWIGAEAADELAEAYRFLRHVEHRLQMIADDQTHKLPKGIEELERVAHFSGFKDARDFGDRLVSYLSCVQGHYDALFERLPDDGAQGSEEAMFRGDDDDPQTMAALGEIGFSKPENIGGIVRTWHSGRYAAMRSERARARLTEILPDLLEALGGTAEPDSALLAFDRFLSELPAGVQLFSLLGANPRLLRLIADIMGTAPRLANVLGRRAQVLDAVLDPGFFGDLPPPDALETLVRQEVVESSDYQDGLDRARIVGSEQAFLIGVRVLSGTISAEQAGGAYALLAENLIAGLHAVVSREIERTHGKMPGGGAAVLAMGKLGGREMTAASDLDLIIVYDFDESATQSTGAKPLGGGQYFARFTQRLISALTVPTGEGALYEVDMRLRPSGNSGPVAAHFDSFVDYQNNDAWSWEHLALTRARVVAGPAALKGRIEETIADVLRKKRDRAKLAEDVRDMRARIEKEKGSRDIWDLKQARGGLVDLEFIAQFLQIVGAHEHPGVLDQNSCQALAKLAEKGLLEAQDADILLPAGRLFHDLTQLLRLCLDRPFKAETASPGLKLLLAKAAGQSDFITLERYLSESQKAIHAAFERIIG